MTKENLAPLPAFDALISDYLEDHYRYHPALAAFAGIHRYDAELEDYSAAAIEAEIKNLNEHRRRLHQIDQGALDLSASIDYRIIDNNISARLLELEDLRSFETNPYVYCDALSNALLRQTLFDYAPAEARLADIIAKQEKTPQLLASAQANLKNPPPILIEVGLAGIKGALSLIENDLPAAFANVGNERLQAQFQRSTETAAETMRALIEFVDGDLRARAHGDYAIGERHYQARLLYEEGITEPVDKLLAMAERELARTQEEFKAAALRIAPNQSPMDTWQSIKSQHPQAGTLVSAAQAQLDTILEFLKEKQLVSWPEAQPAIVAPTPDFYRWSFASMVTPGPMDEQPSPSRYYITDIDPTWPLEKQQAHLTYFTAPILWAISIHEVYPGHFAQFAHLSKVRSRIRQNPSIMPITYVEGWAHYTEQMMYEEGFLDGEPQMRLGQLWEALLRLCRFIVSIKLHTRAMSIEAATQFFVDNAYAEAAPSRSEAERGSFDPMYLCYSLGKLEILKLREEYRQWRGADFSLAEFHHRLLSEGMAPIAYHRELMLDGVMQGGSKNEERRKA